MGGGGSDIGVKDEQLRHHISGKLAQWSPASSLSHALAIQAGCLDASVQGGAHSPLCPKFNSGAFQDQGGEGGSGVWVPMAP